MYLIFFLSDMGQFCFGRGPVLVFDQSWDVGGGLGWSGDPRKNVTQSCIYSNYWWSGYSLNAVTERRNSKDFANAFKLEELHFACMIVIVFQKYFR